LAQLRPDYQFDVSCQGSVPESIISFLESTDFESAIRNAISLGGDADTMACIAGAIAEPFYGGVPDTIARRVRTRLDDRLREILDEFVQRFVNTRSP
jgi:ADP-ribosylglycohydrolase